MGEVYEALQENLGKRVALKLLHAPLAQHAALITRFKREAEAAAKLGHPNIVEVFDFGVSDDGTPYLVMELLAGESLGHALATQGRLPQARVAFIVSQVLAALGVAHRAHFVHRDLKPDNIFLTSMSGVNDIVKLLDFGIAKFTDEAADAKLTNTGAVMGTPQYMSPEQARGRVVDARTDLYAMGVVMYEALTGRPPFAAENYNAILFAILEDTPVALASIRPDLDPALVAVIERAMARKPEDRFADAESMRSALLPWAAVSLGQPAIANASPDTLREFVSAPTMATPSPLAPATTNAGGAVIATAAPSSPAPMPSNVPALTATPAPIVVVQSAAAETKSFRVTRKQLGLAIGLLFAGSAIVRSQFRRAERNNERARDERIAEIEARIRAAERQNPAVATSSTERQMPTPPTRETPPDPPAQQPARGPDPRQSTASIVPALAPIVDVRTAAPSASHVARTARITGGAHNNVYGADYRERLDSQVRLLTPCVSRPDYHPIGHAGFDSYLTVSRSGRVENVRIVQQSNAPQQNAAVISCLTSALRRFDLGEGTGGTVEADFRVVPENR